MNRLTVQFAQRSDEQACVRDGARAVRRRLVQSAGEFDAQQAFPLEALDEALLREPLAQLIAVSLSKRLLHFAVQDEFRRANVHPRKKLGIFQLQEQETRFAYREAWSGFRLAHESLELCYKRVIDDKRVSQVEAWYWPKMERYSEHQATIHFWGSQRLSTNWVAFIRAIVERNTDFADRYLGDIYGLGLRNELSPRACPDVAEVPDVVTTSDQSAPDQRNVMITNTKSSSHADFVSEVEFV